uniref:40S ribosomal protein S26-1 n=1 Tax=Rhizophora mucronata TaxID=61149 RepID=A0A2P2L6Q0_RHIMU
MFLTRNLLIALSLGQDLPQLEQRMNLTWPRPCLLRPPFLRLKVMIVAADRGG